MVIKDISDVLDMEVLLFRLGDFLRWMSYFLLIRGFSFFYCEYM